MEAENDKYVSKRQCEGKGRSGVVLEKRGGFEGFKLVKVSH